MQTHTIRGGADTSLHVREWGERGKAPILMIHGWSQSHLSWERQTESELAQEFHLVALDNRGHGMSEKPLDPNAYTDSKTWANDVDAIIRELELDRPILVGWSYGGLIISDYVRVHGQGDIAGINFAGAATVLNEGAFGRFIGPGFVENFAQATSPDMPTNINAMKRFIHACFALPLSPDDIETIVAYNMIVPPQVRLALGSRELDNTDILERLALPVLVSHGRLDNVVLPAAADYIESHCKTAKLSWYDEVGHAPFLEGAQRFNVELAAFTRACRG